MDLGRKNIKVVSQIDILKSGKIKEQITICPICNSKKSITNKELKAVTLGFKELRKNLGFWKAFKIKNFWDNHNAELTKYKFTVCECKECGSVWKSDIYIYYTEPPKCSGWCI